MDHKKLLENITDYHHADEDWVVESCLKALPWEQELSDTVGEHAAEMVNDLRQKGAPMGQLESFLKDYSLETEEGLALMCLAEALLRVPDKETANALIRDKVAAAN